jgi:two-component system, cell cycle sensor histidine kinase and response regulator CckA
MRFVYSLTGASSVRTLVIRVLLALALGALGALLNRARLPLLTTELPGFLFGMAAAWLAFFWCGTLLGFVAAFIAAGGAGFVATPAGVTGFVANVAEAWLVTFWARRFGSVVAGALVYWVFVGWMVMFGGLWLVSGIPGAYVGLTVIKQICNALMNAVVVEAVVRLAPFPHTLLRAELTGSTTLEHYVLRRMLPAVILPALLIAVLFARTRFESLIEESRMEALQTSDAIIGGIRRVLGPRELALTRLARTLEHGRNGTRQLSSFVAEHAWTLAIAQSDVSGRLVASAAARGQTWVPTLDLSKTWLPYFDRVGREQRAAISGFVPHLLRSSGEGVGLVSFIAEPIYSDRQQLRGALVAAQDIRPVFLALDEARVDPAQTVTVVDANNVVVSSLDPALPPGVVIRRRWPALGATGMRERVTVSDLGEHARLHPRSAGRHEVALQREPTSGWQVVVALPPDVLHARMIGVIGSVVGVAVLLFGGLYFVVLGLARHIADPLTTLRATTARIVAGEFDRQLPALAASPIRELRGLNTDLRQMREALQSYDRARRAREQETEARFQSTFEQAAVGLAHVSLQRTWLRVNMRLCEILGYAPDDLLGHGMEEIIPPQDDERVDAALGRVITGGVATARLELRVNGGDGQPRWAHFTASLGRDAAGEPSYLIMVVEDMSPRRALEDQLRQSQKLESVGRLAGGVAHDFNNLLTAIVGYSDFLRESLGPGDPRREDVDQIFGAAQRASVLTRQLLAFARRQVLEPRVLNVNELASRLQGILQRLIGEDVQLTTRFEADLWNVSADPGQLEQVLLNLTVNARDAMPEGGRLHIETSNVHFDEDSMELPASVISGDYVRITVADSGVGMSEEVLAQAFEPFFTTKGSDKGTGLGLATSYGIVNQLGGHIDIRSAPGLGTTFRILLPATRESAEASIEREEPDKGVRGRETVMLVEDETTVARLASRTLRQHGYTVLQADNGSDALQILEQRNGTVQLLVTDLVMPKMGGRELATRARSLNPHIRVLYMSGYMNDAIAQREVREAGATFLQKPFGPKTFIQTVRDILDAPAGASSEAQRRGSVGRGETEVKAER